MFDANPFSSFAFDPMALWLQLALAGAVAALGVYLAGRARLRGGRTDKRVLAQQHLINRLHKLAQMGETDRFAQTCAWIEATHGRDVLTWMRERAEAEGRTALAARLAEI